MRSVQQHIKIIENCMWLLGNIVIDSPEVAEKIVIKSKIFRIIGQLLRPLREVNV